MSGVLKDTLIVFAFTLGVVAVVCFVIWGNDPVPMPFTGSSTTGADVAPLWPIMTLVAGIPIALACSIFYAVVVITTSKD